MVTSDGTVMGEGTTVGEDGRVPVLAARGMWKKFGRVEALRGASIDVYSGEIVGLIGDNGAGKSTLIRCITGAERPDSGVILLNGRPVVFHGPLDARRAGMETVYQTLGVAPQLDVASNLFLGREIRKKGLLGRVLRMLDLGEMRAEAERKISELGIRTLQDIRQAVETLSGGQRQSVAVARAAAFGTKVLIMDEPTAALGVRESAQVHDLIANLRDRGIGIVLISHNMPVVWRLADRVEVMRHGRRLAVISPRTTSMEDAVAYMMGAKAA